MSGVDAPIETIDDAIAVMDREVDRCLDTGDGGGYFAAVYRAVTIRVRDGITRGEFSDGERMEAFDVVFARRYLDALDRYRGGRAVPDSWRLAFEAGTGGRCMVVQHLLLGINAHINLDLGLAAAAATPPGEVRSLQADFDAINDVLEELVDKMQDSIAAVSPWTRVVDRVGMRFDETLVNFSLRRARSGAWDFAEQLSGAAHADRADLERQRDVAVARRGAQIARPTVPIRWLVAVAGRRERFGLDRALTALG